MPIRSDRPVNLVSETTTSEGIVDAVEIAFPSKNRQALRLVQAILPEWIDVADVYWHLLDQLGKEDGPKLIIRVNPDPYYHALKRLEELSLELIEAAVEEGFLRYDKKAKSLGRANEPLSLLAWNALSMICEHFVAHILSGFAVGNWVKTDFFVRLGKWLEPMREWATTLGVPTVERPVASATKKKRRGPGRKRTYDKAEDRRAFEAMKTWNYKTHADLARERGKGESAGDIRRALDRVRHRPE